MFNKKLICAAAALAIAASMSLCSCGDSGKNSDDGANDTTANAANEAPASVAEIEVELTDRPSAEQYADNLLSGIEYKDQLNPIAADMIEKVYGISPDMYVSGKVYVGGMSTAEEIACFDAADEKAAADIMAALEKRIASQIEAVEGYNPDELTKLNDPVLIMSDNSVYMCLSNDNAKAKEILAE